MDYKVLWYEKSPVDGSIIKFDPEVSLHDGHCFLVKIYPHNQGTAAERLARILRLAPNQEIMFYCYDFTWDPKHLVDITEWFWNEYLKSDRCIFDREHTGWMQGTENRFTGINKNSKKCNWCGQHLTRRIKKVVTVERKPVWEPVTSIKGVQQFAGRKVSCP
jgi:hypothetical protein